jgi:Tol biopolymer transport system component
MVPLSESFPSLSPDGGYVIYVVKLSDGRESLYFMDSSGATRPYGDPADRVRVFGWLPDSKRFVYAWENPVRTFMGEGSNPPVEIALAGYELIRWVSGEHFLAMKDGNLYLSDMNGTSTLLDMSVTDFDFVR